MRKHDHCHEDKIHVLVDHWRHLRDIDKTKNPPHHTAKNSDFVLLDANDRFLHETRDGLVHVRILMRFDHAIKNPIKQLHTGCATAHTIILVGSYGRRIEKIRA